MRKMLAVLAGATFTVAMMVPMFAAETVTGEVVDVACATKKAPGGKGEDHAGCAMACAKKGMPAGIMTDDEIYVITGDYAADNNAKLLDFIAKTVEATGEVMEKDGQKMINVSSMKLAN